MKVKTKLNTKRHYYKAVCAQLEGKVSFLMRKYEVSIILSSCSPQKENSLND